MANSKIINATVDKRELLVVMDYYERLSGIKSPISTIIRTLVMTKAREIESGSKPKE